VKELADALSFVRGRRQGVLTTIPSSGRPQLSNIAYTLGDAAERPIRARHLRTERAYRMSPDERHHARPIGTSGALSTRRSETRKASSGATPARQNRRMEEPLLPAVEELLAEQVEYYGPGLPSTTRATSVVAATTMGQLPTRPGSEN
jgi:hypothetical protein